ncbi:RING finger domain and kelch repeat-containing protein DDB_G0271372-like [Mytilus trossulus]|uniref:RING finger domain and kelch repeat-containing protein DDB_G0271372-like n=1 Tax=Mytilus trossulus TaxID=6551 RepID=UPI0030054DC6
MTPSAFLTEAKCVLHKSEFIYFCTKCHVLICGKCVTTEHKGHDITDIKTVADNYRRSAEGNISDLKVAVTKLSKVVGQMKEIEKPTIKRTSDSAVAEVDASVKKITDIVSFKKENTLYEVQNQLDIEIEEFQYDLKNKERMYEHQNNICESLQRLVHVSHDITFITSYETLKRDIHDISDLVGERGHEQMYKFDKKGFVQEVVNAIVSNFEMCLVGKEDGSVVLTHKTDIKKKEKE